MSLMFISSYSLMFESRYIVLLDYVLAFIVYFPTKALNQDQLLVNCGDDLKNT